jgi:hypothetical protein
MSPRLIRPSRRDSLDEVHVVTHTVSVRNELGLAVSLSGETWRAHVGYPDLDRPQPLGPHPGPVRAQSRQVRTAQGHSGGGHRVPHRSPWSRILNGSVSSCAGISPASTQHARTYRVLYRINELQREVVVLRGDTDETITVPADRTSALGAVVSGRSGTDMLRRVPLCR